MVSFKGLIGASYCQERSVSPEKRTNEIIQWTYSFLSYKRDQRKMYEPNQQKLDVTVCSKEKCQTYNLDDFKF